VSPAQLIQPCCRQAEVAAMLRLAGGLPHLDGGRSWWRRKLDSADRGAPPGPPPRVFGHHGEVTVTPLPPAVALLGGTRRRGGDPRPPGRLIDGHGRAIRGLPHRSWPGHTPHLTNGIPTPVRLRTTDQAGPAARRRHGGRRVLRVCDGPPSRPPSSVPVRRARSHEPP